LVHADYAVFVHEIDHVIATKHGGTTDTENLVYACAQCNRLKGSDIATLIRTQDRSSRSSIHASNCGMSIFVSMVRSLCLFHQPVEPPNDYCS
jgi:hypothetical protein